ncbi:hypothetical protein [Sphingomonas turrisvirgatae]|uniref:WYL domain-containing protein n=1 Tax=Sphingomonas turrisvirgatae TaxID=1888892 RepID=A0A1E3LQI1_9SPHN|nr:hypothetical protein [Sphingomonas turrisvirgatae]ODP36012.1 hypothetical protein BFL28_07975 [Sphingomonas turrisvirgatae]
MPAVSQSYLALALALESRTPLRCRYGGHERVICPIILGHRGGEEMALVYQVAGDTSGGPLAEPQWKCLRVSQVRDLALADAAWVSGRAHTQLQHCVATVDYDVDPASRYAPRRSLGDLRDAG